MLSRIARVPGGRTHFAAAFCRKDEWASLAAEPAPGDDFRGAGLRAGGIDVRGVDKVDARIGRLVEHSMGFGFIRLFSERPSAKDHPRDRQAGLAKFRERHWNSGKES